jgi:DNA-binding transcriptional ArsR family regulator
MNLTTAPIPAIRPIGDLETLRVIVDSQRHRILSTLIADEMSASELAARLKLPRTRIYYHLDLLERHGFIRVSGHSDEGATTRLYRATAASFRVDRSLLGDQDASLMDVRAALLEAAAADLRASRSSEDEVFVNRQFVLMSAERRAAFHSAVTELLGQFASTDGSGDDVEFIAALFPAERK